MIYALKILLFAFSLFACGFYVTSGYDLVKDIYKASGYAAIVCFFASSLSALICAKAAKNLPLLRAIGVKFLGKLSAFYALLHVINFLAIDAQFSLKVLAKNLSAVSNLVGLSAFIIMIFVLFKRKFALINSALFLSAIHFALSTKVPEIEHYVALALSFLLLLFSKPKSTS